MIVGIFVHDFSTNREVFRSAYNLPQSKIMNYIQDIRKNSEDQEGIVERDTYNQVYVNKNNMLFSVLANKKKSYKECIEILNHLRKNSGEDIYDILVTIDNIIFGQVDVMMDLDLIKSMDSQEEKIYNMMIENKHSEIKRREKEHLKQEFNRKLMPEPAKQQPKPEPKQVKIEKSSKPLLIIIKEKLSITVDKENYIKENILNGEISMVIYDEKYKDPVIQMKGLHASIKYSPYLNKTAIKKKTLQFERERGINKSIPLLKWSGKSTAVPLSFECWNDEEDGKYVSVFEIKAKRNLKHIEMNFSKEDITDIEASEGIVEKDNEIQWKINTMKKDSTLNGEIKYFGFDSQSLFPVNIRFRGSELDTAIDVESVIIGGEATKEYEVRRILEVDSFTLVSN
ncbi:hypothetical protein ENBRE01_0500 [Enteropsectra breve]|nr:hypothetical protein ENBRE01_0500 [Enteropsectra breve]